MKPTKYYSNIQEKTIADYLGWDVVAGSGAASCRPGDISSPDWLGECKTHVSPGKRIEFKLSVWTKIKDEAVSRFKLPALFVDDGSQKLTRTWVMFPFNLCGLSKDDVIYQPLEMCDGLGSSLITTSFSFKHSDLMINYQSVSKDKIQPVVLTLDTAAGEVGLCPISVFNDLFHK